MLAIIIPYYKHTFFEATLLSLAAQTCPNFKVYIGDDASPEDPSDLLQRFRGQFDFVYHRFETNLGGTSLTQQWERCIALSGAEEWLMILGDDDVLGENVVEAFYENLPEIDGMGCNVVRFATQVIDGESKAISRVFEQPKLEQATASFWRKFTGANRSSLSEYVFSKVTYSKFGFKDYPLGWHSDDKAWFDFSDGKPIFSINQAFMYIRISSDSITGKQGNVESKHKATIWFLKDLILKKTKTFNKDQLLELLMEYEKVIKKSRKLNLKEWFFLFPLYLKHFKLISFLKYSRRFLISIFDL